MVNTSLTQDAYSFERRSSKRVGCSRMKAERSHTDPEPPMILYTEAWRLTITRATSADYHAVMPILREAADWLSARGNPQWKHWHMDAGERILSERIERHEVYLFRLD